MPNKKKDIKQDEKVEKEEQKTDPFSLFENAMSKIANTSKEDVDKAIKEDKESKTNKENKK